MPLLSGYEDPAAREWIRTSLERGHELSRFALERFDLSTGTVLCMVPSANPPPFGFRGTLDTSYDCSPDLVEAVSMLAARGAVALVVEDELARRGDQFLGDNAPPDTLVPYYLADDHILWGIDLEQLKAPETVELISWASAGWPTNAFFVGAKTRSVRLVEGGEISNRELGALSNAITGILVAAFDAESYVVWEPERVNS